MSVSVFVRFLSVVVRFLFNFLIFFFDFGSFYFRIAIRSLFISFNYHTFTPLHCISTTTRNALVHFPMSSILERLSNGQLRLTSDTLLAVLAIFLPPFPVLIKRGFSFDLLLNVFLSFLAYLPGLIHSWYIIVKYKDDGIPGVSTVFPFSGTGGDGAPPATATRAGYQQIPDENVPSSFQNAPRLESGLYQGPAPAPAAPPQQSGAYKYPPGPTAGNSSSSGAPSNAPPAYDGSTTLASGPPAAPGDNKIQYGSQF